MLLFNKVDVFWRAGSWRRSGEWVFGCNADCSYGCKIIEAGFITLTIFNHRCPELAGMRKK